MKKWKKMMMVCLLCSTCSLRIHAQSFEVQQLLLDCEKLTQLKSLYKDLVKGYEVLAEG